MTTYADPCLTCHHDAGCPFDERAEARRDDRLSRRASEQEYLDRADQEARW